MTSPPALNCAPRRMLPPPTTMASWTPRSRMRWACRAMLSVSSMLMPLLPLCPNPSPLSFRITRLYLGLRDSPEGCSFMGCSIGEWDDYALELYGHGIGTGRVKRRGFRAP